eukprot:m.151883 g.151883  ORF g.151883 m.151883 type:complete len:262 (-) comp16348_c0_seq1:34-819(-)
MDDDLSDVRVRTATQQLSQFLNDSLIKLTIATGDADLVEVVKRARLNPDLGFPQLLQTWKRVVKGAARVLVAQQTLDESLDGSNGNHASFNGSGDTSLQATQMTELQSRVASLMTRFEHLQTTAAGEIPAPADLIAQLLAVSQALDDASQELATSRAQLQQQRALFKAEQLKQKQRHRARAMFREQIKSKDVQINASLHNIQTSLGEASDAADSDISHSLYEATQALQLHEQALGSHMELNTVLFDPGATSTPRRTAQKRD